MRLRRILAANVQTYLDVHYPLSKHRIKSNQQKAFANDSGVSWSSIQRALDPSTGVTLDVIADVAVGMEMKGADLITPGSVKTPGALPPQTSEGSEPESPFEIPTTRLPKKRRADDSQNPPY